MIKTKVFFVLVFLLLSTSLTQAIAGDPVCVQPNKNHKIRHGKPLFTYPQEHFVYIVTYSQEDLQKMRKERMFRTLTKNHQRNIATDDDSVQ